MFKYQEEVIPSKDATKLYREGKITEEELLHIRYINKLKYSQTEKGLATRKRYTDKKKQEEGFTERNNAYHAEYYRKNREIILRKQKEARERKKLAMLES